MSHLVGVCGRLLALHLGDEALEHGGKGDFQMMLLLALVLCLLLCLVALARMRVYGLTGGIACGKSTVSAILASRGFHIVDADLIAHEILRPGTVAYNKVLAAFGHDILVPAHSEDRHGNSPPRDIDRAKLRDIVFRDSSKRKRLNAITHPALLGASCVT